MDGTNPAFERLHWRLMGAYVLVTTLTTLILGLVVMAVLTYEFYLTPHTPDTWVEYARNCAAGAAPLLEANGDASSPDLVNWVEHERQIANNAGQNYANRGEFTPSMVLSWYLNPSPRKIAVVVIDQHGVVIVSAGATNAHVGQTFDHSFFPQERLIVHMALMSANSNKMLAVSDKIGLLATTAPIRDGHGHVLGAILIRSRALLSPSDWFVGFGSIVLYVTVFMGLVGTVFGAAFSYITSRGLTRRLAVIATVSDDWSRGDFAPRAPEAPGDELGQLATRLNGMAEDLGQLIALRQGLAASEERNRLARDLHDTVKQQAFAAAMQVGAARGRLPADPAGAGERLDRAAEIIGRMQQRLATILHELSATGPCDGDGIGSLRRRAEEWSRESDTPLTFEASPPEVTLSGDAARSLQPIVEEALSNVARHSQAASVSVTLRASGDGFLEMCIVDDGCGLRSPGVAGMGLQSMRARAESLPEGAFALSTASDAGGVCVTVRFRLPGSLAPQGVLSE